MHRYDLICIGCGPAGEKAATQAAYFGKRVAIVEQQARPGGAMVNTGTLPSKMLRETALLCSAFRRRPLPGVEFELDRNLSVARFMARRHLIEQQEHDRIESSMDRHGIEIHHGRGRLLGPHVVEVSSENGSKQLGADYILIATGSSPLRPKHVPFDDERIVDADGVLGLRQLPGSMIIVGGGVIGCEYASVFAEIQVDVRLIHHGDAILPFVDADCRERLMSSMRDQGVNITLNTGVASVAHEGDQITVMLTDGQVLRADALLWAAGRSSNTAGLGLEESGVRMGDRGLVLVDEHYRTNVPSIYAAGDVIGFPALAATSMEQGRVAACSMFGINFKTQISRTMPIGLYTIPAVSMVGLSEVEARKAGREVVIGSSFYRGNARGRMLGDEQGMLKCVFDRSTRKLLGACVVGEDATELIHLAQCMIASGLGIDYLIDTCFNYPSLSELYKYAAYAALQDLSKARPSSSATASAPRAA
jgi:NAD(P) transhydrogenase